MSMGRFVKTALGVALMASAASASAQQVPARVNAGALLSVCNENQAACLTYVLGAIDGVVTAAVLAGRPNPICIPAGTTNRQLADAAVRYLRAHPEEAATNGAAVVAVAVRAAYPCPRR